MHKFNKFFIFCFQFSLIALSRDTNIIPEDATLFFATPHCMYYCINKNYIEGHEKGEILPRKCIDIIAEYLLDITHSVIMMNWKKTGLITNTDAPSNPYKIIYWKNLCRRNEKSIYNDEFFANLRGCKNYCDHKNLFQIKGEIPFYVAMNKKLTTHPCLLRKDIFEKCDNEHFIECLNIFFQKRALLHVQEILFLDYNLWIHLFDKGFILFIYYTDEKIISGIQCVNTNFKIHHDDIAMNIDMMQSKITVSFKTSTGKSFMITGEVRPEKKMNVGSIMYNFNIISSYLYQNISSCTFSIPLQNNITLSNSIDQHLFFCPLKFPKIFKENNTANINNLSVLHPLPKNEYLTIPMLNTHIQEFMPHDIANIVIGYLFSEIYYYVKMMDWKIEPCDQENKFNGFTTVVIKKDDNEKNPFCLTYDFSKNIKLEFVIQGHEDDILTLKQQIFEHNDNKIIFEHLSRSMIACKIILILEYKLLIVQTPSYIILMHYSDTKKIYLLNFIYLHKLFQSVELLLSNYCLKQDRRVLEVWDIYSLHMNRYEIVFECMNVLKKKFYIKGSILKNGISAENLKENIINFDTDLNIIASYVDRTFNTQKDEQDIKEEEIKQEEEKAVPSHSTLMILENDRNHKYKTKYNIVQRRESVHSMHNDVDKSNNKKSMYVLINHLICDRKILFVFLLIFSTILATKKPEKKLTQKMIFQILFSSFLIFKFASFDC